MILNISLKWKKNSKPQYWINRIRQMFKRNSSYGVHLLFRNMSLVFRQTFKEFYYCWNLVIKNINMTSLCFSINLLMYWINEYHVGLVPPSDQKWEVLKFSFVFWNISWARIKSYSHPSEKHQIGESCFTFTEIRGQINDKYGRCCFCTANPTNHLHF